MISIRKRRVNLVSRRMIKSDYGDDDDDDEDTGIHWLEQAPIFKSE